MLADRQLRTLPSPGATRARAQPLPLRAWTGGLGSSRDVGPGGARAGCGWARRVGGGTTFVPTATAMSAGWRLRWRRRGKHVAGVAGTGRSGQGRGRRAVGVRLPGRAGVAEADA